MAVIKELIRKENDGTLSFGNFEFDTKQKKSDFEYEGDLYKVKTFKEITKLEKNGLFVYESVPGTVVTEYRDSENGVSFCVEGIKDTQVIVAVSDDAEYEVKIDGAVLETYDTNLSGKLVISLELGEGVSKKVEITRK